MGRFGIQDGNAKSGRLYKKVRNGSNVFQQKVSKSRDESRQVNMCRQHNLTDITDCKVVEGESVARQCRMVVCGDPPDLHPQ